MKNWIRDNMHMLKLLKDSMRMVSNGSVELYFQDGKFIGLDARPRIRKIMKNDTEALDKK